MLMLARDLALSLTAMALAGPPDLAAQAQETLLNPIFQEGAVLQQGAPIAVWGHAPANEPVRVTLGAASLVATADADGRWRVLLPPTATTRAATLEVFAGARRQAIGVAVGEVWLCSGQSNIEMPLRLAGNGDREIATVADPDLRLLTVPRRMAAAPQEIVPTGATWRSADKESATDFSAACLFFGQRLRTTTNGPVGLIAASWGGSIARAWTSTEGLQRLGGYDDVIALAGSPTPDAAWRRQQDVWWPQVDVGSRGPKPWSTPDLVEDGWTLAALPETWRPGTASDLAEFDGAVWFRRTIVLASRDAGRAGVLNIGGVDDADTVWINGREVGRGIGGSRARRYDVPPGLLTQGANTVAIRILDTGGAGGVIGEADAFRLELEGGSRVPLAGLWRRRLGSELDDLRPVAFPPSDGAKTAGALFNGMIAPLAPYTLAGVAWYQGESDAGEGLGYQRLLEALVNDWRRRFAQPLPFLVVQISAYGPLRTSPHRSRWAEVREAQRLAVAADPTTALVVTTDIGDAHNIHPSNKQELGRRLALAAGQLVYGEPAKQQSLSPRDAIRRGGQVIVSYSQGAPAWVYGSDQAIGFQLCEADRCAYAAARHVDQVSRLKIPRGLAPTRVRYCWEDTPICNIFSPGNLPATPFQLDIKWGAP